jgi:putative redox protein
MSALQHQAHATTAGERYTTDIHLAEAYRVLSDAPAQHGGGARGPSPVDLLTGALAACKTMTAKMYADRKGWPVESVRVQVRHVLKDVEGQQRDVFECEVTVTGDLTDEQRQRVYEIAAKCPVHRMLEAHTRVESTLRG